MLHVLMILIKKDKANYTVSLNVKIYASDFLLNNVTSLILHTVLKQRRIKTHVYIYIWLKLQTLIHRLIR